MNGYFPYGSERALGAPEPDPKSYIEYLPETKLPEPLMSAAAGVYGVLLSVLRGQALAIARGLAPMYPEHVAALLERAPAPVLRVSFYAGDRGRKIANYPHTDIDLVTLLPRATAPGLQIASQEGWLETQVDPESILVLAGEMLELMGGPPAELHRVVGNRERISISFFVNASLDEPLPNGKKAGAVLDERLKVTRAAPEPI
jgi:isopenicillin N synthase-like dioxygenase